MKAYEVVSILCRAVGMSVVIPLTHRLLPLGGRWYRTITFPSRFQDTAGLYFIMSIVGILALVFAGLFLIRFSNTVARRILKGCDTDAVWISASKREFHEMVCTLLGGFLLISLFTEFYPLWSEMIDISLKENVISNFGIWLQLAIGIFLVLGPYRVVEKFRDFLQWGHGDADYR